MSKNDLVLAIVEPDIIPREVIERAAWMAERTGSELMLLLCDADVTALAGNFFVSSQTKAIAEEMRAAQRGLLEELAEPVRRRDIAVKLEVLEERPVADAVLQRALDLEPRFVFKGTQYHSEARRSIFVDTDWHLVRTCPYPLWLVKDYEMRAKPMIVAAVDPVEDEERPQGSEQHIVTKALAVAADTGGEVHLLHTYQALTGIGREATRTFKPIRIPVDEISERIGSEHRQRLDALAAANGIPKQRTHQLPGAARDVIPFFARDRKADLIVMGAVARWGLQRAVIGSTAEKVLDHLPCDILVVKPD